MHPHDTTDEPVVVVVLAGRQVKLSPVDVERVMARHWMVSSATGRPDDLINQIGGRNHRVTTYLHRVILDAAPGTLVDHRNRDTFDCRRANLRFATPAQNSTNAFRGNRAGFKGVTLRCDGKKWVARIQFAGKGRHLGSFATPEEAARAYDRRARTLYGEYAALNFPDDPTE